MIGYLILLNNFDAENIFNGKQSPVCHLDRATDGIDPTDLSDDGLVAAAVLSLIRHKIGDGCRGPVGEQFLKTLQFGI